MLDSDQQNAALPSVSRVSIKPPPFWKANPTLWFAQLEAQFSISGITEDSTKFNHVISAVESDVLNTVSDIVLQPPSKEKYIILKNRLIDLHSESEESRIRRLLQGLELGDQRPSQLLTRMRSLAGATAGEAILKSLWLSRLPTTTQSILAALSDGLTQLAAVADKISDLSSVPAINTTSLQQPSQTSNLEAQISQLTKQVSELSAIVHQNARSRQNQRQYGNNSRRRSQSRGQNRQYKEPSNNLCFYHTNFGSNARKCTAPCSFRQSEN